MTKHAVHFSAKRDDHGTPKWLYSRLDQKYGFKADLFASKKNALHKKFFTIKNSALENRWPVGWSFANPPYGRQLYSFLKYAVKQSHRGAYSIWLIPARTDTKWFHEIVMRYASHVKFIKGRIKFEGNKAGAPFPSMLVYFSGGIGGNGPTFSTMEQDNGRKDA